MRTATLDFHQVLSFTGLSESTAKAKGQKVIINKLNGMGVTNINVEGRGKKAVFSFTILEDFWMMLMVPVKYSAVSVEVMKLLMDGNVRYINGQELYLFSKEVLTSISIKHGIKYDTVEQTYTRIKRYLMDHDLLFRGEKQKSHRIMRDGKWITGVRAIEVSNEIKATWRRLFTRLEENSITDIRKRQAECHREREFIERHYRADNYRVIKFFTVDHNLVRDIRWAENAFYADENLAQIKEKIVARHSKYKADKIAAEELLEISKAKNKFDWDKWIDEKLID